MAKINGICNFGISTYSYECQTQLEIAMNIEYLREEQFQTIYKNSREVEALLRGLKKTGEQ